MAGDLVARRAATRRSFLGDFQLGEATNPFSHLLSGGCRGVTLPARRLRSGCFQRDFEDGSATEYNKVKRCGRTAHCDGSIHRREQTWISRPACAKSPSASEQLLPRLMRIPPHGLQRNSWIHVREYWRSEKTALQGCKAALPHSRPPLQSTSSSAAPRMPLGGSWNPSGTVQRCDRVHVNFVHFMRRPVLNAFTQHSTGAVALLTSSCCFSSSAKSHPSGRPDEGCCPHPKGRAEVPVGVGSQPFPFSARDGQDGGEKVPRRPDALTTESEKRLILKQKIPENYFSETLLPHLESQITYHTHLMMPAELCRLAIAYSKIPSVLRQSLLMRRIAEMIEFRLPGFQ